MMSIEHLLQNFSGVKKSLETENQNEMIITEWLFQEPTGIKI